MNSIVPTIRSTNNMKIPTSSKGKPASLRKTSEPPSIIPSPTIPRIVIAVRNAEIGPMFWLPDLSFRFAPQRLQKLKPWVMGAPQVEQYMLGSSKTCRLPIFDCRLRCGYGSLDKAVGTVRTAHHIGLFPKSVQLSVVRRQLSVVSCASYLAITRTTGNGQLTTDH